MLAHKRDHTTIRPHLHTHSHTHTHGHIPIARVADRSLTRVELVFKLAGLEQIQLAEVGAYDHPLVANPRLARVVLLYLGGYARLRGRVGMVGSR